MGVKVVYGTITTRMAVHKWHCAYGSARVGLAGWAGQLGRLARYFPRSGSSQGLFFSSRIGFFLIGFSIAECAHEIWR